MTLKKAQLLSSRDLDAEEIQYLFRAAQSFAPYLEPCPPLKLLENFTIANLFFEDSTRTRTSFETAVRRLSGTVLNFSASGSSLSKGESLEDTATTIEAMKPHCLVVRHKAAGCPHFLAKKVTIPVVNAGDGGHDHPTQGLLDAFTLEQKLGDLKGKNILLIGDIQHARVAHANIPILQKLGAQVSICGPPTLIPRHWKTLGVKYIPFPEQGLSEADAVMTWRIQFERQNHMQVPSAGEYSRFWGLNPKRVSLMKKHALILHPGPMNRGVEIAPEVTESKHSVILDQVTHGILIRMAVLSAILNPKALDQWLSGVKKNG